MRALASALILLVALALPGTASAGPKSGSGGRRKATAHSDDGGPQHGAKAKTAAKARFDRGIRLYNRGDYRAAAVEFHAAFERDPTDASLFAWAQAARLSKDCTTAVKLYHRLLAKKLEPAQRAHTRDALRQCRAGAHAKPATGATRATGATGATGTATPGKTGTGGASGTGATHPTGTGAHGAGASRLTGAGPGARQPEQPERGPPTADHPTGPPVEAPSPPAHAGHRSLLGPLLLGALGVAGAGTGLGFYLSARSEASLAQGASSYDNHQDHAAQATRQQTIAIVAAAAGASLVTGALIWAIAGGGDAERPAPGAAVGVISDGRGVGLTIEGVF